MKFFNKLFKKEKNISTIRDLTILNLYHVVKDYSDWYEEHGLYLPPDYATNPGKWTEVLQKIKRSFELLYDELLEEGDLWEAKNKWKKFGQEDVEETKRLEKEVVEGLTLFGKYLFYLNDPKANG